MNFKVERINTDILRVLTLAIQKSQDASLADIIIQRVETTADLSEAKVYVNGGLLALEHASGFLRTEVAQRVKMKQAPRLKFIVDRGLENAERVEELLKLISKTPSN